MKNNVKFVPIITCCVAPSMGPLRVLKQGTSAWPQTWNHCVAPSMGPLRGPKHGTTAWPQAWDLTNTPSMGGGQCVFSEEFLI